MINPNTWKKPNSFISIAAGELPQKPSLLVIDTRTHKPGNSFLCLKGDRFDSHDFVEQIYQNKTPVIIFNSSEKNKLSHLFGKSQTCWIEVSDSLKFFQDLAFHHIQDWKTSVNGKVIAISGSNGKTTTRFMLTHLFKDVYSDEYVVTNQKNNNNHIGVPLTIMDINESARIAIIELGSNSPGEIETVCRIADPDFSFTTNIGATHLEFFNGIEDVFLEESFPYTFSNEKKRVFFLNSEDEFLSRLAITEFTKELTFNEVFNSYIQGEYNFYNLSMAVQIASYIDRSKSEAFSESAKRFKPTRNRGELIQIKGAQVFLDAYNANPSSMRASINGFLQSCTDQERVLLVVGDMNELGDETEAYHVEVAKWLKSLMKIEVVFVGRFSSFYLSGFPEARSFESREDYQEEFLKDLTLYDRIFLKASRSVALEKLIQN